MDGGKVLQNFESYKPTMGDLLGGADTAILLASKAIPDNDGGYTLGVAYNSWVFPVGFVCKAGAGTYLTFTHELAHMFSADHDQDTLNEQKSQPAVPYGRGLLVPGTNKHTIMAWVSSIISQLWWPIWFTLYCHVVMKEESSPEASISLPVIRSRTMNKIVLATRPSITPGIDDHFQGEHCLLTRFQVQIASGDEVHHELHQRREGWQLREDQEAAHQRGSEQAGGKELVVPLVRLGHKSAWINEFNVSSDLIGKLRFKNNSRPKKEEKWKQPEQCTSHVIFFF